MTYVTNSSRDMVERRAGHGLWSGIFAGVLSSSLAFWILFMLGTAIGGHTPTAISGDETAKLSLGAGIWTVLAAGVACFLGGYFCSRIVLYSSWRAGVTEGLIVSSVFFLFLTVQSWMGISFIGQGVSRTAGLAAGASSAFINRGEIRSMTNEFLSSLNIQANPETVGARVMGDLLRGDVRGARNYLATQSSLSGSELDARLNECQQE